MIRKDTTRRLLTISIASVLVLSLAAFTPVPVYAPASSVHVAVIGTLTSSIQGDIPNTNAAFAGFTFTNLVPGSTVPTDGDFSSACLNTLPPNTSPFPTVACDTIVIFMPTSTLACSVGSLTAQEQASIDTARSTNNLKLIIYDSECASLNYNTMITDGTLQFVTNSGGAFFGAGTAVIVEQNSLSTSGNINVVNLCQSDACGDSNLLTSQGTNLCVDMTSTNNNNQIVGLPVHVYSRDLNALGGLLLYNGFDMNPASPSDAPGTGTDQANLAQLFLNELSTSWLPSGLLCNTPVVQQVGGDYVSLDSTSLFVSGLAVNALWMLPMLAAGGVGAGVYFARGKFHKVEN